MAGDRSVSEILQDTLRHLQEIVRAEVRLAKVEIRQEATQAASSGLWVGAGIVAAVSAWLFLLWTAAYALATVVSMWVATLVVAVAMAGVAGVLIVAGIRRFKRIQPIPERTVETLKEHLEWMKQPTK